MDIIASILSILLHGIISLPVVTSCDNIHKTTDYAGAVTYANAPYADVRIYKQPQMLSEIPKIGFRGNKISTKGC